MRLFSGCLRFFLLATITLPALAAAPSGQADLDEVTVSGERVKIEALRKQIVQLEDRFYDRYNELNTVDDFDIHCIEEARTGTRFIKRSCRAVYQEQALAEEGQAAFRILQRFREKGPAIADSGPPVPATLTIQRRLPEYQKNLEEVARKDPELTRLLQERGKLIESYDAALKKAWGLKPPPEAGIDK
ncbi:MAG TPA: hypothetical protein VKO83_02390 [Steroidobacteraceae bacterium]|nr:hypothetical protein [Steroidobacteraceae bacterium]